MNKTRNQKILLLISLFAFPAAALAADATVTTSVTSGLTQVGTIIGALTTNVVRALSTLFATAAMVAFFYGVVQYIWGVRDGDESRVQKGNIFLRWGLVALFVMFSVWGIVTYVQTIFGIQDKNTIIIPTIQLGGTSPTTNASPLGGTPTSPATGTQSPNGNGGATAGADCAVLGASCGSSGLVCTNYTCQQPGSSSSGGSCSGKADGASCTLPSGSTGTCGSNDEGTRGCYVSSGGSTGGAACSGMTDNQRITCLRNTPCPDSSQVRDDSGACVSATNY
jgi:hypothetical protein